MDTAGIYIELKDGKIKNTNFELLTLAKKAGREIIAVLFAENDNGFTPDLAQYGVDRIILVKGLSPGYQQETYAKAIAQIISKEGIPDFVCTHSAQGKDLLPRVAAELEAPLTTDCISIDLAEGTAVKPVYAGRIISEVKLKGTPRLFTLRPNTIKPEKQPAEATPVVEIFEPSKETSLSEIREIVKSVVKQIELTEARVIISGGRGLRNGENFKLLEELAQILGAAVGASRAAVDAGFAPQSIQVGQTGKTVSPVLYIACGISGASQHLAGMKTSKIIVAINKDPEAPIFQKADYGIVGDVFEVLPIFKEELGKILQNA